jgi:hypothetical protein
MLPIRHRLIQFAIETEGSVVPGGQTSVPVRVDAEGTYENCTVWDGDEQFDWTVAVISPAPLGFRSRTETATLSLARRSVPSTVTSGAAVVGPNAICHPA